MDPRETEMFGGHVITAGTKTNGAVVITGPPLVVVVIGGMVLKPVVKLVLTLDVVVNGSWKRLGFALIMGLTVKASAVKMARLQKSPAGTRSVQAGIRILCFLCFCNTDFINIPSFLFTD